MGEETLYCTRQACNMLEALRGHNIGTDVLIAQLRYYIINPNVEGLQRFTMKGFFCKLFPFNKSRGAYFKLQIKITGHGSC